MVAFDEMRRTLWRIYILVFSGMSLCLPPVTVAPRQGSGHLFQRGLSPLSGAGRGLARAGTSDLVEVRRAVIYGSAVASFCVEGFSLEGLKSIRPTDVEDRVKELKIATAF